MELDWIWMDIVDASWIWIWIERSWIGLDQIVKNLSMKTSTSEHGVPNSAKATGSSAHDTIRLYTVHKYLVIQKKLTLKEFP